MGMPRRFCLLLVGFVALILCPACEAQGRGGTGAPERKPQVYAVLAQLMRGILFPASNIIFEAPKKNPADVKPAKDPSGATDLLNGSYGQWEAVENSALAIAETANLLMLPGRKCSNGRDVPVNRADWPGSFRDCGMPP